MMLAEYAAWKDSSIVDQYADLTLKYIDFTGMFPVENIGSLSVWCNEQIQEIF